MSSPYDHAESQWQGYFSCTCVQSNTWKSLQNARLTWVLVVHYCKWVRSLGVPGGGASCAGNAVTRAIVAKQNEGTWGSFFIWQRHLLAQALRTGDSKPTWRPITHIWWKKRKAKRVPRNNVTTRGSGASDTAALFFPLVCYRDYRRQHRDYRLQEN